MELEWNSKASEISQQRVKIQLSLSTFDISLGNWDGIKFKRWINTKFLNNGAQTRYSRYSSLSPSDWSGIKFEKIFHKTNLTLSINCEKKFGISIPSSNREFNPIQSEGSEGFVTYRSSRFFSIHAGKVKFLRGDVETGVDWQTLFFFLSNKSWRVKVPACIIPSGKVEIIKISNFQTGVRREKTYDWAAWDGQCRGFPYRACELRSNFELGKLETGEKKKKKKNCFLFDAWWRRRKITSFPTIIRVCWLGYVFVVAVFWKVFVILFFSLSLFFRWEKKIWKSFELPNRIWEECK